MRIRPLLFCLTVYALSLPGLCHAGDGVKIDQVIVAKAMSAAQRDAAMKAVQAFYAFWNTGDEALLNRAISDHFTDRTLPPGRPQGPAGPAYASKHFRTAVPDLGCEVEKVVLAGDYATVHMKFTGHFSGTFGSASGKGEPIAFIATDLVKIENGRITDNWHIEDNLTLLQQMGVAKLAP